MYDKHYTHLASDINFDLIHLKAELTSSLIEKSSWWARIMHSSGAWDRQ